MKFKNITKMMAALMLPVAMLGTAAPVSAENLNKETSEPAEEVQETEEKEELAPAEEDQPETEQEETPENPEEKSSEEEAPDQEVSTTGEDPEEEEPVEDYSMLPSIPYGATGSLTIKYYDDSYETVPAAGAEFTAFKIADISRGYISAAAEGEEAVPLVIEESGLNLALFEDIPVNRNTDAVEIQDAVIAKYEDEENLPESALKVTGIVGDDGILEFVDMPIGAYLIVETHAIPYHIATTPFLVSIPETTHTEDGLSYWNFDIKAEPKVNLAGSLVVEKIISGAGADKNQMFSFRVDIAEGEYVCIMPDGKMDTVKNGDVIRMKGGQHFSIVDLPVGSEYKVTEIEANKNGYSTTYKDSEGLIIAKDVKKATVKNSKDKVPTGVGMLPMKHIAVGMGSLFMLLVILAVGKKRRGYSE